LIRRCAVVSTFSMFDVTSFNVHRQRIWGVRQHLMGMMFITVDARAVGAHGD
jgi:hypothetical protein